MTSEVTSMTEERDAQCPHCHERKERSPQEVRSLLNRLSRIEGQVRGLRSMVERDAYCPDVLRQAAAAAAALESFERELLASHIRTCVAEDIRQGKDETIDELLCTLRQIMK